MASRPTEPVATTSGSQAHGRIPTARARGNSTMKAAPAARLEGVVPTGTQLPADQMMRAAAQLTTSRELRHFMRLWVEIVAAAARSEAPFVAISTALLDGFLAWVRKHLALAPGEDADAQAALVVAMIDGLALIDICRADDLVVRAAGQL